MNQTLVKMAREYLKETISKCTEAQIAKFKQLHCCSIQSRRNLEINDFIDTMPEDRLDWATSQVENTVKKNQ